MVRPEDLARQDIDRALAAAGWSVHDHAELEQTIRANLARAATLRQAVLKRAVEGKLVPRDPIDEPASVLLDRIRAERAAEAGRAGPTGKRRAGRGTLRAETITGGENDG
jgi:hypothetical protein